MIANQLNEDKLQDQFFCCFCECDKIDPLFQLLNKNTQRLFTVHTVELKQDYMLKDGDQLKTEPTVARAKVVTARSATSVSMIAKA